jgi:hypothetical protein
MKALIVVGMGAGMEKKESLGDGQTEFGRHSL